MSYEENSHLSLISWNLPEIVLMKYREVGIHKLFQWQAECLCTGKALDGGNLIYSAPTSAGKTLVAELLMLKSVIETKRKAFFILPFVSAVIEKVLYLKKIFEDASIRVGGYHGGENPAGGLDAIDVAVCTIEKANNLINRMMEENRLHILGCIVVDELHLVGDPHRGYLLELLITKINYFSAIQKRNFSTSLPIQLIGMSATLTNLESLSCWFQADLYKTFFRPIPLQEMIKVGSKILDSNGQIIRHLPQSRFSNDEEHIVHLCHETVVQDKCSVLVFCPSKNWCEKLADSIARQFFRLLVNNNHGTNNSDSRQNNLFNLSENDLLDVISQLKRSPSGIDVTLNKTLKSGVAYHHAGLTFEERNIIEGAYRKGILKVLVATSTLSSGVNLPARRVIIRSPMFLGKPLDNLVYKQMVGRAGRKGVDIKGESILICKTNELQIGLNMMNCQIHSVESCLDFMHNNSSFKRAILEIIVNKVANCLEDLNLYADNSLSRSLRKDPPLSLQSECSTIKTCLEHLITNEFVCFVKDNDSKSILVPTNLGEAVVSSGLSPDEGLKVFVELQKARRCFVLENDLHLVYLATPMYIQDQINIDWYHYVCLWETLSPECKRVAEVVGVSDKFLSRTVHGKLVAVGDKSIERVISIHKRFYLSLALFDLVNESPLKITCSKFKITKGTLQSLQQAASTYAGMITSFCAKLGWKSLETLFINFQCRFSFGICQELVDLVRISVVNSPLARKLYEAGFITTGLLAEAKLEEIEKIIKRSHPFDSNKKMEDEEEWEFEERLKRKCIFLSSSENALTEKDAAYLIKEEAKKLVAEDLIRMGFKSTEKEKDSSEKQGARSQEKSHQQTLFSPPPSFLLKQTQNLSLNSNNNTLNLTIDNDNITKKSNKIVNNSHSEFNCVSSFEEQNTQNSLNKKNDEKNLSSSEEDLFNGEALSDKKNCFSNQNSDSFDPNDFEKMQFCSFLLDGKSSFNQETFSNEQNQDFELDKNNASQFKIEDDQTDNEFAKNELLLEELVNKTFNTSEFNQDYVSKTQNLKSSNEKSFEFLEITSSNANLNKKNFPISGEVAPLTSSISLSKKNTDNDFTFLFDKNSSNLNDKNSSNLHDKNSLIKSKNSLMKSKNSLMKSKNSLSGNINSLLASKMKQKKISLPKTKTTLFSNNNINLSLKNKKKIIAEKNIKKYSSSKSSVNSSHQVKNLVHFTNMKDKKEKKISEESFFNFKNKKLEETNYDDFVSCDLPFKIEIQSLGLEDKCELNKSIDFSSNLTGDQLVIYDVASDKKLYDKFISELNSQSSFSMSLAFSISQENQKKSLTNFQPIGIAISWESFDVYYLCFTSVNNLNALDRSMAAPDLDDNIGKDKKINDIKKILQNCEILKSGYNMKRQMKMLLVEMGINLEGKLYDLMLAEWVLDSRYSESSLFSLASFYCPNLIKILEEVGIGPEAETLGISESTLEDLPSPRMKACVEALVVSKIFQKQKKKLKEESLWEWLVNVEMRVLHLVMLMELNGFGFDEEECERQKQKMLNSIFLIEHNCYRLVGHPFNLSSSDDLNKVLFLELKLPPSGDQGVIMKSKKTSKRRRIRFSTKKDVLEKLSKIHPIASYILEWRKMTSALSKVVFPLQQLNRKDLLSTNMNRIHCQGSLFTSTGRITLAEPNLQNIPKIFTISSNNAKEIQMNESGNYDLFDEHKEEVESCEKNLNFSISLRDSFIPFKGGVILTADYSQLELRIIAHISNDKKLIDLLNSGGDVFVKMAAEIENIKEEEVTSQMRQHFKQVSYGIIYGMSFKALSQQLNISLDDASKFIENFKNTYPSLKAFLLATITNCKTKGFVTTLSGRKRFLPGITHSNVHARNHAERQAVNTTIQGSGADIVKQAMIRVQDKLTSIYSSNKEPHIISKTQTCDKNLRGAFFILQLHDELIFEVNEKDINIVANIVKKQMEKCEDLKVKMPVKLKIGKSWGKLEDIVI